jgi:hypothetical protein
VLTIWAFLPCASFDRIMRRDPLAVRNATLARLAARAGGQSMPGSRRDDKIAMQRYRGRRADRDQPTVPPACECRDATLNLVGVATGVNSTPNAGATVWMAAKPPDPAGTEGSRMTAARVTRGASSLSSFPEHGEFVRGKTGGVAAWVRQARNPAAADRIDGQHEHRPIALNVVASSE